MRRMPLVMVGLLIAAPWLAGCGGMGTEAPGRGRDTMADSPAWPPTARYMPLAVGNNWRLKVTEYQQPGALSALFSDLGRPALLATRAQTTHSEIHEITGTTVIDETTWFVDEVTIGGQPLPDPAYLRHNAKGLLLKLRRRARPSYQLKTPLAVGNTWTTPGQGSTLQIVAVGQMVTVPAGKLRGCIAVAETGTGGDTFTRWWARGVGPAKGELRSGDDLLVVWELAAYHLETGACGSLPR